MNKNEEILKLKRVLIEQVKSENDSRYANLSSDAIIKIVIDASNKGKYVFWVLREYLKGNIQRFEDMGRVKQALILFKNNLSKFTEQQKQLNKMSFQELETLVSSYQEVLTQNEIKRIQKEKIWSEIDVIYEGVEGRIYVPKTQEAAIFLGQGTKWCTAARNDSMFNYYNEQGPLYVFVLPEKDRKGRELKYQLHFSSNQFMDANDITFDIFNFEKKTGLYTILFNKMSIEEKIKNFIENDMFFSFFNKSPDFSLIWKKLMIEKLKTNEDWDFIKFIELNSEVIDLYELMINYKGKSLFYIPDEFKTYELCKKAVENNTRGSDSHVVLGNIPEKYRTEEICDIAVRQNALSLNHIPRKYITYEMCCVAVRKNGLALSFVPDELKTYELCKEAIQHKEQMLWTVPKEFLTSELCEIAVQNCIENLQYVPDEFRTDFLHKSAIQKNGYSLYYVPEKFIDYDLCKLAVSYGSDLRCIPEEFKTKEIYELAVQNNPMSLFSVPEKLKTREMCEIAVMKNGDSLDAVPKEFRTHDMCMKAINSNSIALIHMPEEFITEQLCISFVEKNGYNLVYLPVHMITKEICEIAIQSNLRALENIPHEFISKELYEFSVKCELEKHNLLHSFDEVLDMLFNLNNNIIKEIFEPVKEIFYKYYIENRINLLVEEISVLTHAKQNSI